MQAAQRAPCLASLGTRLQYSTVCRSTKAVPQAVQVTEEDARACEHETVLKCNQALAVTSPNANYGRHDRTPTIVSANIRTAYQCCCAVTPQPKTAHSRMRRSSVSATSAILPSASFCFTFHSSYDSLGRCSHTEAGHAHSTHGSTQHT